MWFLFPEIFPKLSFIHYKIRIKCCSMFRQMKKMLMHHGWKNQFYDLFFNLSRKTASSVIRTFYQCSLVFPYQPTFIPHDSFAILFQDSVIVLDNLVIQNMLWRLAWENNKSMSIHCNTNTTKDNNRSFQFLIKLSALPKLFSSFKILSDYVLDFITPQETEDMKIRYFRRKKTSYKTLNILGHALLTQQLQGSGWCKQW